MKKKLLSLAMTVAMILVMTPAAHAATYEYPVDGGNIPGEIYAIPTASAVLVDSVSVAFDAYNINGNNYFKLRDLAFILSGSQVQFEVSWDASANAIRMTSGASYTPVGGEMSSRGKINQVASPTASAVLLDGSSITLTAYNIGGNNYFKLRDIGSAFNFGVEWDGVQNMILIDTTKPYTA